jgi:hypothetical protein
MRPIADANAEWTRDILEELFDELGFLLARRDGLLSEPDIPVLAVRRIDDRVRAHADALVLAGRFALPVMDEKWSEAGPPGLTALALVLSIADDDQAQEWILELLDSASPEEREAIGAALILHAGGGIRQQLAERARRADDAISLPLVVADPTVQSHINPGWLTAEAPQDRRAAWWLAAGAGAGERPALVTEAQFQQGLGDPEPSVRRSAIVAALWRREPWWLAWARSTVEQGGPSVLEASWALAVAGEPEDGKRLLGARRHLGDLVWFDCLAASGRVEIVEMLIDLMRGEAPPVRALAGRAFTRLTGLAVTTEERIPLPTEGDAEVDPDFADEIEDADPGLAAKLWSAIGPSLQACRHLRRGADVSQVRAAEWPVELDAEARQDAYVRDLVNGRWQGRPWDPLRLSGSGPWGARA